MKMKNALLPLSLAAALTAVPLAAQPKPADVVLHHVNDHRTGGTFGALTIGMTMPKVASADVAGSRVLVASAVDDTGASLVSSDGEEPKLETNSIGPRLGNAKNEKKEVEPMVVSLALKNPSRKATKVKEVRGEIELFMPGRDPMSVADVPKFMSFSGKPIAHKALKANGIEIVLLSKAQIDAERKKIGDAKRKEYKEAGYEDGEDLENNVKSAMEYALTVEESDVPVRVKDPKNSIQELEYVDGNGEVQRVYTRNLYEDIGAITTWGSAPGKDWTLRVKMRTAKNLVRYPFVIRDVPLP